ncbi:MAG: ATP-binding protein [Thermodesulfobacteriota bacterium]
MGGHLRFSLRTRLLCGFLAPALILAVVIYLDYANLSALGRSAETILAKNYKSIQAAHQIARIIQKRQDWLAASLTGLPHAPADTDRENAALGEMVETCRSNVTEIGEREIVGALVALNPRYQELFAALRRAEVAGEAWPQASYRELLAVQKEFGANLARLIAVNESAMELADQQTRRLAQRARIYSIALLASALALVLIMSLVFSRRISQPLVELAGVLGRLRQDRQEYPRLPVRGQDEIGFLTGEFNRLFERLRAFDQANLAKLNAEQAKVLIAEQAKARFIADLSHQLKTPMTSLAMSVNLLARKLPADGDERQHRLVETAVEDCARLAALINELVNLARLEAMVTPRPRESIDIPAMVEKCLRPLAMQAEEKGVTLTTTFAPDLPRVSIDSFRFPWVITNLVGNALRYTPAGGGIAFSVGLAQGRMVFTCSDSGSGIRPEYLPHIFDRYAQFAEREAMGTIGLGLAIVKEIVEQHGGDIGVESHLGQGATFELWIPLDEG